jgi:hypothetical protein
LKEPGSDPQGCTLFITAKSIFKVIKHVEEPFTAKVMNHDE